MHSRGLPHNMLEKKFLNYGENFLKTLLDEIDKRIEVFREEKVFE